MSTPDLKPCPFCGAEAAYTEHEKTNETRGWCPRGCGAEGPFGARSLGPGWGDAMARDGWNIRPIEDALRARAEAAEVLVAALRAEVEAGVVLASALRAEVEAGVALSVVRAEIAEVTLTTARAEGASLRDQLDDALRRAREAEAALATARAEGAAAERAAIVADLRSLAAAEDLCAAEAEMSESVGRGRINGGAIVRRGAAALRAAAGVIEGRRPVEGA
jgi:hypothetical protein